MRIFDRLDGSKLYEEKCVVALGCFDGVHKGHAHVLRTARKKADALGLPLCVFAFDAPPRNFFSLDAVPLITCREDKLRLFEEIGVDISVCIPFDKTILSVSAQDFIKDVLIEKLKAEHLICGYNYTFGKGAAGDPSLIKEMCEPIGIGVTVVGDYIQDGIPVSSSLIRELVSNGEVDKAVKYLGRPYSITAPVVNGQHLARRLGFPTVNILPTTDVLIPRYGVYVSSVSFDSQTKYGITNVGVRPTVDTHVLCAETHLFDFEGDLYGKEIRVEFLYFLRGEVKFDSVDKMAERIRADIETAKEYINHI